MGLQTHTFYVNCIVAKFYHSVYILVDSKKSVFVKFLWSIILVSYIL